MRSFARISVFVLLVLCAAGSQVWAVEKGGRWGRYELLSTVEHKSPPVSEITLTFGPVVKIGSKQYQWWEVAGKKEAGEHYAIRLLSEGVPMANGKALGSIMRYILREGDDQPIEYIDSRTGNAFLPKFEFTKDLLPATEPFLKSHKDGFASTGTYLGHVIALTETGANRAWSEWPAPTMVKLNPDEFQYIYGLARDTEGHYIKKGDYNYVPLTQDEVNEIVDLGANSFNVDDKVEEWIYRRPVFYYKQFSAETKLKYPELLYRSNFRGAVPFIDEPEIHILQDRADLNNVRQPEQGAYILTKRVEEIWNRPMPNEWRRSLLRDQLRTKGVNLGTLALDDNDHPIWVTMLETSSIQLQGGAAGVVHEGRYRLDKYTGYLERFLGKGVEITNHEMLLLNYAFLRGAARSFNKSWGTAIYGQCDPAVAPEAITLAYDMGARYIWLWTYGYPHHLPHFMKLKLLKDLQDHKAKHPRGSLNKLLYAPRTAIMLPYGYGYDLALYNMWDAPNCHINYKNDLGTSHREVMAAALAEGIACAKAGEDFDFVVDIGQALKGYNRTIKIGLDGQVTDSRQSAGTASLRSLQTSITQSKPTAVKPVMEIPYTKNVEINGNMSKLADLPWVTLDKKEQVTSFKDEPWNGPQDLSAQLSFARDNKYFYLLAQVTDDKHSQDWGDNDLWQGDSLEFAMDLMLDKQAAPLCYAEVLVGLTQSGPQVFLVRNAEGHDGGPVRDAKVSMKPGVSGNVTYEIAIPWRVLTTVPLQLIDSCAIRFRADDNDGTGRKCAMEFGSRDTVPDIREGFAFCKFAPLPTEMRQSRAAFVHDTRSIVPANRKWELAVDADTVNAATARLEINLDHGGRKAASGTYPLKLSPGRNHAAITIDAASLRPGTYHCRAKIISDGAVLADTVFPVYVLK